MDDLEGLWERDQDGRSNGVGTTIEPGRAQHYADHTKLLTMSYNRCSYPTEGHSLSPLPSACASSSTSSPLLATASSKSRRAASWSQSHRESGASSNWPTSRMFRLSLVASRFVFKSQRGPRGDFGTPSGIREAPWVSMCSAVPSAEPHTGHPPSHRRVRRSRTHTL